MPTKEIKNTYRALRSIGLEPYDAERYTQSLHSIALLVQTTNEIECSVHASCEPELEAVGDALAVLVKKLADNIGLPIHVNGDPRGYPLKIYSERVAAFRNGSFEHVLGITGEVYFDQIR